MTIANKNYKPLSQEMHYIMDHAHALVDATSGELDDRIMSARTALKKRLEAAKDEFGDLEAQFLDKVQTADEFIHVKPYYAIGGTFIAGLLLGWFMSRK
ncbi:MAG: hypothetical protein WC256_03675 [Desulfurivibrionaceae bacterium]|jgi:ElaB/YqjD/DUF883 family membrane-anchored ribosome-binding protein